MWPWPLTFWPWTVVIPGGSCDRPSHQVWSKSFCPCAKSHDLLLVGDVNVLSQSYSSTSTYRIALQKLNIWSHLQPFSATFLLCIHKKRLFVNFRYKFWHHRSIPRPWFPHKVRNFSDLKTPLIFALYILKVHHISTSSLFDLLT